MFFFFRMSRSKASGSETPLDRSIPGDRHLPKWDWFVVSGPRAPYILSSRFQFFRALGVPAPWLNLGVVAAVRSANHCNSIYSLWPAILRALCILHFLANWNFVLPLLSFWPWVFASIWFSIYNLISNIWIELLLHELGITVLACPGISSSRFSTYSASAGERITGLCIFGRCLLYV